MVARPIPLPDTTEDFIARLTAAAYGAALKHGLKGSFLEAELEIWHALREAVRDELGTPDSPHLELLWDGDGSRPARPVAVRRPLPGEVAACG